MTTTVELFIQDKAPVLTAGLNDDLMGIAHQMTEQGYSQLPIVDDENRPLGIVTSDSIVNALANYGIALSKLKAKHALQKNTVVRPQDIDLFDLFEAMHSADVALIVKESGSLLQIVTNADTAAYFQEQAQNIMLVENIETMIKDCIQLVFAAQPNGQEKLEAWADKRGSRYNAHLSSMEKFEKLSLSVYIKMFLFEAHWPQLEAVFNLPLEAIQLLLTDVRHTRNALAHFHGVTAMQARQLRFCYNLLSDHQTEIESIFGVNETPVVISPPHAPTETADAGALDFQTPTPSQAKSNKYTPLADWLQDQSPEQEKIALTFSQVEEIIKAKLPSSAFKHRAWWSNNTSNNVQSKEWLEAGWRVSSVNMGEQIVRYSRIAGRQLAYINFYSDLITQLRQQNFFTDLEAPRPNGTHAYRVYNYTGKGKTIGWFDYSFGHGGVFRVQFVLNTGEQASTKRLFDRLHQDKQVIEKAFGQPLNWWRENNHIVSAVNLFHPAQITDSPQHLAELRTHAVKDMITLFQAIHPYLDQVVSEIL